MRNRGEVVTCYKVFAKTKDGCLRSCVVKSPGLAVEYRKGLCTTAKLGGLLCFAKKAAAIEFSKSLFSFRRRLGCTHEVWEVSASGKVPLPVYSLSDPTAIWCKNLWNGRITDAMFPFLNSWPDYTVSYRRVKPIRLIESHDDIW